jgi:hypothetical protein
MDSHQRRVLDREMRRMGLSTKPPIRTQKPNTVAETPFIRDPEFAIAIALFSLLVGTVLTVLGARLKDLSWFFFVAWIFAIPATYIFCGRLRPRAFKVTANAVILAAIAGGLYYLNVRTRPREPAPVTISPEQVVFRQVMVNGAAGAIPSQFSQQYTFRMTNTTDRDVYAIGAELRIKSDHLSVDDFNLGIPRSSWKPLDDSAPEGARTGDMMAEGIRNREANTSYFAVAIAHLEPRESREVTISESDPKAGNDDTAVVTAAIYHSTFEPAPTLKNGEKPMLMPNVPLPESGTLEKIVALPHIP